MTLCLSAAELEDLTGKVKPGAQAKELAHLGVPFQRRRDGSILVYREAVAARPQVAERPEPRLRFAR